MMKIKKVLSIILSIACMVTLSMPISAVENRASSQIALYAMKVTSLTDKFSVHFSVTGPGNVDKLGCESIYFYKLVNTQWVPLPSLTMLEDDPGMSRENTYEHTNSILCSSEAGESYKIVVTIFSENSKGRDTRSETFYRIGQ